MNYKNGSFKTCPRCKGHGYMLGQKKYSKEHSGHLPDYRKNKKGLCFLCDGKKEAFFTDDNKVLKFKRDKFGSLSVIEFCPVTGNLIGELENLNPTDTNYSTLNKEFLFPNHYEDIVGGHSAVFETILKEHPKSKIINSDYYFYDDEYIFSFLMYYDKDLNLIKPFYIEPKYDELDLSLTGMVLVNDDYSMVVSGIYYENDDSLHLGIKNNHGFNSAIVLKVKDIFNIYKNKSIKQSEVSNFINNVGTLHPIMIKILTQVSSFVDIDIFN